MALVGSAWRAAVTAAIAGWLLTGAPEGARAEGGGRLLIFNKLGHLLKGDIWQSVTQEEVGRHLYVFPENHLVIGMGTTNWPERMGEVIVKGTIGKTVFQWANPEYPYQVRNLRDATFPWLQVAVVDPKRGLSLTLERTEDLHAALMDQMRLEGIRLCAFFLEAITHHVEYSLTYRIPKGGLDLSGPGGKEAYLRAFQDETRGRWLLWGLYVEDELAQSSGMIPGQPLLLVGYNRDTNNGGLVRLVRAQTAQVQYHPIASLQVFKSELTVSDLRFHEGRVSIDVRNNGDLTAEHVKVRLSLPDSKRESEAVLPSVRPKEEVTVRFTLKRSAQDKRVEVHVDPDNQILEGDDQNNRLERRHGWLGW
jgi:hypothetical protein